MTAKILIVDDHLMMRQGLRLMLRAQPGLTVVGEADCAEQAWPLLEQLQPDIVVVDVEMPGVSGIELARRIKAGFPAIKVVMLSGHAEAHFVNEALQAGVVGYLLKNNGSSELLTALRTVLTGQTHVSPQVSSVLVQECRNRFVVETDGASRTLSGREREILKRVADGQTTKEIAFALQVSPKTVETHRLNVMTKLGVRSIAELTKYAVREGLTSL